MVFLYKVKFVHRIEVHRNYDNDYFEWSLCSRWTIVRASIHRDFKLLIQDIKHSFTSLIVKRLCYFIFFKYFMNINHEFCT